MFLGYPKSELSSVECIRTQACDLTFLIFRQKLNILLMYVDHMRPVQFVDNIDKKYLSSGGPMTSSVDFMLPTLKTGSPS